MGRVSVAMDWRSLVVVRGCYSICGARLLVEVVSLDAERRLQGTRAWALGPRLSS